MLYELFGCCSCTYVLFGSCVVVRAVATCVTQLNDCACREWLPRDRRLCVWGREGPVNCELSTLYLC